MYLSFFFFLSSDQQVVTLPIRLSSLLDKVFGSLQSWWLLNLFPFSFLNSFLRCWSCNSSSAIWFFFKDLLSAPDSGFSAKSSLLNSSLFSLYSQSQYPHLKSHSCSDAVGLYTSSVSVLKPQNPVLAHFLNLVVSTLRDPLLCLFYSKGLLPGVVSS